MKVMPHSRRSFLRVAAAATLAGAARRSALAALARPLPVPRGPYEPTWLSVNAHYRTPEWFHQAKFGIAVHWGVYTVAASHDDYARDMYGRSASSHTEHYGPPDKFGYKDLIPLFKFEKYNADAWAELFRKAGARYVIPMAEDRDGFAMWESKLTKWCAGKMGPKRDLIGELARAARRQGLILGAADRRMEHHSYMYPAAGVNSDQFDAKSADLYGPPVKGEMDDGKASPDFQEDWLARCQELIDRYQPQILVFGSGLNHENYDDVKVRCAAYYYNRAAAWGKQATIATRGRGFPEGAALDLDKPVRNTREIPAGGWQVETPIAAGTWSYVQDMRYRPVAEILEELVTTVSQGGNLLLNISPKADGSIPAEQQEILNEIGRWMSTNGEALYESQTWQTITEGDFRFTTRAGLIYAMGLKWPEGDAVIPALASRVARVSGVSLLGGGRVEFAQSADALTVKLPRDSRPPLPFVLKIAK